MNRDLSSVETAADARFFSGNAPDKSERSSTPEVTLSFSLSFCIPFPCIFRSAEITFQAGLPPPSPPRRPIRLFDLQYSARFRLTGILNLDPAA